MEKPERTYSPPSISSSSSGPICLITQLHTCGLVTEWRLYWGRGSEGHPHPHGYCVLISCHFVKELLVGGWGGEGGHQNVLPKTCPQWQLCLNYTTEGVSIRVWRTKKPLNCGGSEEFKEGTFPRDVGGLGDEAGPGRQGKGAR